MTRPQLLHPPTSHTLTQTEADRAATPPVQLTCVVSDELTPQDRPALLELFERSSPESRRNRFHHALSVFPRRYLDEILTAPAASSRWSPATPATRRPRGASSG